MSNFFTDNEDIQFQLNHMDLREIVELKEGDFSASREYPDAPANYDEAIDGYRRVLDLTGEIAGEHIAPRAADVDKEGCHYEHGSVTYAKGTQENLKALKQAGLEADLSKAVASIEVTVVEETRRQQATPGQPLTVAFGF